MKELYRFEEKYFYIQKMKDHSLISDLVFPKSPKKTKTKDRVIFFNEYQDVTNEEEYVANYGNPLCSLTRKYATIVVESNDEKISLKIFSGNKTRLAGNVYFVGRKDLYFFTFSKKTGDFYHGKLGNYGKKTKSTKSIYKNAFTNNFLGALSQYWNSKKIKVTKDEGTPPIQVAIDIFSKELFGDSWQLKNVSFQHAIIRTYLDHKKIKYPDNYIAFYTYYIKSVPLKQIRKHKNNLIDAFMKKNGLHGGVVKKVLHTVNHVNTPILALAYFMFPEEWVNQNEDMIKKCFEFDSNLLTWGSANFADINSFESLGMTKSEIKKVYTVFQNVLSYHINLTSFIDHVQFYYTLKTLGETNIKWTAIDKKSFQEEHCDYTEKIEYHTKGTYVRVYQDYVYEIIEEPIKHDNQIYYPKLLNTTESYVDESNVQSNCVKTYIGSSGSYIVSLRKNELDSKDRASVEFKVFKDKNKVTFTVPQFLGRFNSKLDNTWEPIILEIEKRFRRCIEDDKFETVKLVKEYKSGKKLSSDSYFDENGNHRWCSVDITNYY